MLPPDPGPEPEAASRGADGTAGDKDTQQTKTAARATEQVETDSVMNKQKYLQEVAGREGKQGSKPAQPKQGAKEDLGTPVSDTYNKKPKVVQAAEKEEEGVSFMLRQAKQVAKDQVDESVSYDQGLLRKTDLGDENSDNSSKPGEKPKSGASASGRFENKLGEKLGKTFPALSGMLHAARVVSDASW